MRAMLKGQIVKIIKNGELDNEKNTKFIYFTVADRTTKREVNGKSITDFYFCKAFGTKAELINKHFNINDDNGKFISRKIDMYGTVDTYQSTKPIEIKIDAITVFNAFAKENPDIEIPKCAVGVNLNISDEVPVSECCFTVHDFDFVDFIGDKSSSKVTISKEGETTISISNKDNKADSHLKTINKSNEVSKKASGFSNGFSSPNNGIQPPPDEVPNFKKTGTWFDNKLKNSGFSKLQD